MIRTAKITDAAEINALLSQLGYLADEQALADKIGFLIKHPDHALLVYEQDEKVVGFIDLHFIPQLPLNDFAHITYFCVDTSSRGSGIGAVLLERAEQLAKERHCDRVFLHCNELRTDAHRFYEHSGYIESPAYFVKKVI